MCRGLQQAQHRLAEAESRLVEVQDDYTKLAAEHDSLLAQAEGLQHQLRAAKRNLKEVQAQATAVISNSMCACTNHSLVTTPLPCRECLLQFPRQCFVMKYCGLVPLTPGK